MIDQAYPPEGWTPESFEAYLRDYYTPRWYFCPGEVEMSFWRWHREGQRIYVRYCLEVGPLYLMEAK
jgi:hypothetical protein